MFRILITLLLVVVTGFSYTPPSYGARKIVKYKVYAPKYYGYTAMIITFESQFFPMVRYSHTPISGEHKGISVEFPIILKGQQKDYEIIRKALVIQLSRFPFVQSARWRENNNHMVDIFLKPGWELAPRTTDMRLDNAAHYEIISPDLSDAMQLSKTTPRATEPTAAKPTPALKAIEKKPKPAPKLSQPEAVSTKEQSANKFPVSPVVPKPARTAIENPTTEPAAPAPLKKAAVKPAEPKAVQSQPAAGQLPVASEPKPVKPVSVEKVEKQAPVVQPKPKIVKPTAVAVNAPAPKSVVSAPSVVKTSEKKPAPAKAMTAPKTELATNEQAAANPEPVEEKPVTPSPKPKATRPAPAKKVVKPAEATVKIPVKPVLKPATKEETIPPVKTPTKEETIPPVKTPTKAVAAKPVPDLKKPVKTVSGTAQLSFCQKPFMGREKIVYLPKEAMLCDPAGHPVQLKQNGKTYVLDYAHKVYGNQPGAVIDPFKGYSLKEGTGNYRIEYSEYTELGNHAQVRYELRNTSNRILIIYYPLQYTTSYRTRIPTEKYSDVLIKLDQGLRNFLTRLQREEIYDNVFIRFAERDEKFVRGNTDINPFLFMDAEYYESPEFEWSNEAFNRDYRNYIQNTTAFVDVIYLDSISTTTGILNRFRNHSKARIYFINFVRGDRINVKRLAELDNFTVRTITFEQLGSGTTDAFNLETVRRVFNVRP